MLKTKYLFTSPVRVFRLITQNYVVVLVAISLFFAAPYAALATSSAWPNAQKRYSNAKLYPNFKTYQSSIVNYNSAEQRIKDNSNSAIQLCQYEQNGQYEQGWQSGQVDHLGQSNLEIYTNEQGDEVMRTTPRSNNGNNSQGNTYYFSPQVYPMPPNAYPPPHFRPGQKPIKPGQRPIPRPKPQ